MDHYNVCPGCQGRGSYTNPSIDGHGITEQELRELGDDFRDDYMAGVYDVTCVVCKGLRVVTDGELKDWIDDAEDRAMIAAEKMMGA